MMGIGIQSLNDDVLSLIITHLSQGDAARLSRTSRTLREPARRRILSSLKVTVPVQAHKFHTFLVEDHDGYRLQCLQKLTVYRSNLPAYEPADGYTLLARVLEQARNLRTLVVSHTEDHLNDGPALGEAIAELRDLHELDLRDVAEETMQLCGRLSCKPSLVRLTARSSAAHPSYAVDRATLCALPIFQNASVVSLHDFALTRGESLSLETLVKWPATHTLRLRNVDPIAIAAACPNLVSLQLAFCWHADDAHIAYPYDGHYPYTALAPDLATQVRTLDTFVDNEESMLEHAVTAAVQGTHPAVLSTQSGYGETSLWSSVADVLKQPGSRVRYVDVLMHDDAALAQQWLDECLPLLGECNILCVRLRLDDQLGNTISPCEWEEASANLDDEFGDWDGLREAAPEAMAKALPSLQYVAIACGYMVEDGDAPGGSVFAGRTRWWRVQSGGPDDAEVGLKEVESRVGETLDAHLRSEEFSKTLKLGDEWLS